MTKKLEALWDAVDYELVMMGSTIDSYPDVKTAVKEMIDWNVKVALDPIIGGMNYATVEDDLGCLTYQVHSVAPLDYGQKLYTHPRAAVPVVPAPKYRQQFDSDYFAGRVDGWNACREALLSAAKGEQQ